MRLRNRAGEAVDPTPWLVTASLGFMVLFSFGPIYLGAFGVDLRPALVASGLAFLVVVAVTYWRYVHTARPDFADVPAEDRLRRLFYGILAAVLVLGAATVPLVTQ